MQTITIGCDPEVFLKDSSGKFVSAHDLIPGSKYEPHPVPLGAIQPDGVSAEFNINPSVTSDEFVSNIATVMKAMENHIRSMRPDLVFAIEPTATFDQEYFSNLPEVATLLGCSPDFNAYTMAPNNPPHTDEPFRTGAGHIHVGWGSGFRGAAHFGLCCDLVKQLDAVLFVQSLLWDSDDKRRSLYGNIGAFRPKPYGMEYRPLSNAFLKSQHTQRWVFEATKYAVEDFFRGVEYNTNEAVQAMVDLILSGSKPMPRAIRSYMKHISRTYGVPSYD